MTLLVPLEWPSSATRLRSIQPASSGSTPSCSALTTAAMMTTGKGCSVAPGGVSTAIFTVRVLPPAVV